MPAKLNTTIKTIDIKEKNQTNRQILRDFCDYLQSMDTSENYQNGLFKVLIRYTEYMKEDAIFYEIQVKEQSIGIHGFKKENGQRRYI